MQLVGGRSLTQGLLLLGTAAIFFAASAALVVGIVQSNPSLIGFSTAAMPGSLAAAAAAFGVKTWADARRAAIDEKSREALEIFILNVVTVFHEGLDLNGTELLLRSNAVTWGSPALLAKLAERTAFIDQLGVTFSDLITEARALAGDPNANVNIDIGYRKAQYAKLVAEAVSLARTDLGLPRVPPRDLYEVLFGKVDGLTFEEVPPLDLAVSAR